jgi:hypothetical protein
MAMNYLTIVRRDRPEVLATLRRMPVGDVHVILDRRQTGDRRRAGPPGTSWTSTPGGPGFTDRRRRERRGPLPTTWETLGFVLTPAPGTG